VIYLKRFLLCFEPVKPAIRPERMGALLAGIYKSSNTSLNMRKKTITHTILAFSLFSGMAFAGTVNIPESKPAVTVDVPAAWKPEKIDNGITIESPDQAVTMYMEVTAAKASDDLLKENLEYLKKEQNVTVDMASMKVTEAKIGGQAWHRMSFD